MDKPKVIQPDNTWEENVSYLLDHCPYTIRQRQENGAEDLVATLAVTFVGMQARIKELEQPRQKTNNRVGLEIFQPKSHEQSRFFECLEDLLESLNNAKVDPSSVHTITNTTRTWLAVIKKDIQERDND